MTTRFVNQFTLGNLLTIAALVVAGFVAWNTTQTRISLLEAKSLEQEKQFNDAMIETRRVRPEVDARLRVLENIGAGTSTEIAALRRDIGELKETMRDLSLLLRKANGEREL